jgi:glycerophosphoryl diester phosphodiesterase
MGAMKKHWLFLTCVLLIAAACNKYKDVAVPDFGPNSILNDATPLPDTAKKAMEGIFSVADGNGRFGDQVVLKWSRDKASVFCGNGCYMVLGAGSLDSVIILQGYWRYAYNDETGLVTLKISKEEGGAQILSGQVPDHFILRGGFGQQAGTIDAALTLDYTRAISPAVLNSGFNMIAHRSGGRTSDRLPVSENSIEMINYTHYFGSTGIEIDVQLTKDGIPILYHDADLNIRLIQKGAISGPIGDFTWLQLYTFVKLIHGERIPKLEDALRFVVDSTDLHFVWLDMKSETPAMSTVIPIQQAMLQRAAEKGRDLVILIGLPTTDAMNDFMNYPDYKNIPSLCELTLDDVRNINARAWAPRWTLGLQNEDVQTMHNEGRKAYCWTIDQIGWIQEYVNDGHFDGLLTNFPSIVAYYHYIKEN